MVRTFAVVSQFCCLVNERATNQSLRICI